MRAAEVRILSLAALMCSACSDIAAPVRAFEEIGVLQLVDYSGFHSVGADESVHWSIAPKTDVLSPPRLIMMPDTVDANAVFDVTVTTIGLDGCWRAAGQRVEEGDHIIEITPIDTHSGARACTAMVAFLDRVARVRIASPGVWTLRVKGRRLHYQDGEWEEQVSAERTIVVR